MPRLLYAWETGADLGHVSVFLPVARDLRDKGWTVCFAIPLSANIGAAAIELVESQGFRCIDAPGSSAVGTGSESSCHADFVASLPTFSNSAALTYVLKTWLAIFEAERTDVVVGDYALSALMAARVASVVAISLDLGFYYPEIEQPLPEFDVRKSVLEFIPYAYEAPPRDIEQKLLEMINGVLVGLGSKPMNSFSDIYLADSQLLLNSPELAAFPRINKNDFLGPVIIGNGGCEPDWPVLELDGPKVFAYLKLGSDEIQAVLDALKSDPLRSVIAYVPDCPSAIADRYRSSHFALLDKPADITKVLNDADLVICHAGAGLLAQSLLAGIPVLTAPMHLEQMYNAFRASETGAAVQINVGDDSVTINERIDYILSDAMVRARARAFRLRNAPAEIPQIRTRIEDAYRSRRQITPGSGTRQRTCDTVSFRDFDVVFLSYDEPNAEQNWELLKERVPGAKRVHGVSGFDAAHKAAADASDTERFILVDADNQVHDGFFDLKVSVPPQLQHAVWQWCSINAANGLAYPYGGLKVWTREIVRGMRTHEACDDAASPLSLDFWAQPAYQVFSPSYSTNYTNASPLQAFRSGFRETLKLAKFHGHVREPKDFERFSATPQGRRVAIWMSVGADVTNGYWSMLGARMGFLSCFGETFEISNINQYDWFDQLWERTCKRLGPCEGSAALELVNYVEQLGREIRSIVKRPPILDMSPENSAAFRSALASQVIGDRPVFSPFRVMVDFQ